VTLHPFGHLACDLCPSASAIVLERSVSGSESEFEVEATSG